MRILGGIMLKNEIFYSLSKYEIHAITEEITNKRNSSYLNIIITFKQEEFNNIYKLLSNLYTISNKEEIEAAIWETFICHKIIKELDKYELIYYPYNIEKEEEILKSYNLDLFIKNIDNRSTFEKLNQIIKNQISKNVVIHYFQDEIIIPIELQKIINHIFVSQLSFTNILYTTRNSLKSYFMHKGYWVKQINNNFERWDLSTNCNREAS